MVLKGIRVVDWSVFQVGPYAAVMLADMGAEVIHLEEPGRGDALRGITFQYGLPLTVEGRHILFEEHNRNKKGLAVDLHHPLGREAIYRLVEKSDVFLTNYRASAVARYGMDYETLLRYNPRLIYARASGYGFEGPDKDLPSIDLIAQARSGMMLASGEEGSPPAFLTLGIGDRVTSFLLAYGVTVALLARERLGIGQRVDISQLGAMAIMQGNNLMPALFLGRSIPRHNRTRPPRNPLYNSYRCKDDRWVVIAALGQGVGKNWLDFCNAIGRPNGKDDPRFASEEARMENREELVRLLDEVFSTRTAAQWEEAIHGSVDIPFTAVNQITDLIDDEQMTANKYIVDWDHPVLGRIKFPGFPVSFSETPPTLYAAAPECGEHTEEILTEVCGYTWEEMGRLKEAGVIP